MDLTGIANIRNYCKIAEIYYFNTAVSVSFDDHHIAIRTKANRVGRSQSRDDTFIEDIQKCEVNSLINKDLGLRVPDYSHSKVS